MVRDLLPLIVSLIGAGGLVGAVIALIKLRPEAGQIVVTAAQGALIVQTGVIDSLKEYTARQQQRIDALEGENTNLRERLQILERDLRELRDEFRNGRKDSR